MWNCKFFRRAFCGIWWLLSVSDLRSCWCFKRTLTPIDLSHRVACIPEHIKHKGGNHGGNYICDVSGNVVCLPGWRDARSMCAVPVCQPPCHPDHGQCTAPNTCTCKAGYEGSDCSRCVPLPGCKHGYCANRAFQCKCLPGWTGMLCDKPICKDGCEHGHCNHGPGQCVCHPGWTGPTCSQCIKLPGCTKHGFCRKPLQCVCKKGYSGTFCHKLKCRQGCDPHNGFCHRPNECWCRPGWSGPTCTECLRYPGCDNGYCLSPWECRCTGNFTGRLCDRPIKQQLTIGSGGGYKAVGLHESNVGGGLKPFQHYNLPHGQYYQQSAQTFG